ncbi:MAG TPA: response regulator [Caulobacteraceae bacterium]|nr:response regulator [Caulobacteraceae bacterium]
MPNAPRQIVLVVEDEVLIRLEAAQALSDHGYEVVEAEHAAHAISICVQHPRIDLLFTDVNMPGDMNGIDLAEYLLTERPRLKIIITSAAPLLRSINHLEAAFLPKPYEMMRLREAAAGLLAA